MITMQQALTAKEFWHVRLKNADGTPLRVRRTGRTQTWKREPGKWSVPCKHGLKTSIRIQTFNLDHIATYGPAVLRA